MENAEVREHLTERFGGLTALRSPAQGATSNGGKMVHDEIIVFEVMAETLDGSLVEAGFSLSGEFRQDKVVIRPSTITPL